MVGLNQLTKQRKNNFRKPGGLSKFRNRSAWRKKQSLSHTDDITFEKVSFS